MDGQTPNLRIFRCVTGLRGYHVYQVDWKPIFIRVNYMYLQMFSPSIALISCIYKCSSPIRVNLHDLKNGALISYNKVFSNWYCFVLISEAVLDCA